MPFRRAYGLRALMGLLGAAAMAFGIVVLVGTTPQRLIHWLAVTDRSGWLCTITGAAVLIAALAAPVFFGAPRRRLVR